MPLIHGLGEPEVTVADGYSVCFVPLKSQAFRLIFFGQHLNQTLDWKLARKR